MQYGYADFPFDFKDIFKDILTKYNLILVRSTFSYQEYSSDLISIVCEIDHEAWIGIGIYHVSPYQYYFYDYLEFIDSSYYHKWEKEKYRKILRNSYINSIKNQLPFFKNAIELYFVDILETGKSKFHEEYIKWRDKKQILTKNIRNVETILSELSDKHPIKRKIKKHDRTWIDDIIALMREKGILLIDNDAV